MRLIDADRLKRQVEGRSWRAKGKFIEMIDKAPAVEPDSKMMINYYVCNRQNPKCCKSPQCGDDCWITTYEEYAVPGLQAFSLGCGTRSSIIAGIEAESYARGYWAGKAAKDDA